jgi:hypothetical protein
MRLRGTSGVAICRVIAVIGSFVQSRFDPARHSAISVTAYNERRGFDDRAIYGSSFRLGTAGAINYLLNTI